MIKRMLLRLQQWYSRDLPLRTKLLISHMTLILIPTLVLAAFFYGRLYDALVTDTVTNEQALTQQTASTLEATLARVAAVSDSVAGSIGRLGLFEASVPDSAALQDFSDSVRALENDGLITSVRIYLSQDYDAYLAAPVENSVFFSADKISTAYWYGIFSSTAERQLWCPTLYLSPSERADCGGLAYIICLPHSGGQDAQISIAVYFSRGGIDRILQQNVSVANSAAYILNGRDAAVSVSDAALSGAYSMSNHYLSETVDGLNRYAMGTYLGRDIYIGYYTIGSTDWRLVSVLPADDLVRKGRLMVVQFVVFYLLFSVFALGVSLALSHSITRRITAVAQQMKTVESGKPVPLPCKNPSHDEVGVLTDAYNYMANEINDLLEKQSQTAKALQLSEFRALQAQINPHFLYNSLDMINWMSLAGESTQVTKAIRLLSRFYKLTLSRKDTLGTVERELEHVSLYVQLQNMRFDNCIQFIIDVPDELMENEIPKLIFQPIVENSLLHGILEKAEKHGCITLTGWRENADVVFYITDDGVGMDEAVCRRILQGENNAEVQTNIGVYNTHARLRLFYGSGYGLKYKSEPGKGTEVEIRLPLRPHV